jgi:hypothetical protein
MWCRDTAPSLFFARLRAAKKTAGRIKQAATARVKRESLAPAPAR